MSEQPSRPLLLPLLGVGLVVCAGVGFGGYLTWDRLFGKVKTETVVPTIPPPSERKVVQAPHVPFADITARAGIHFTHCNGASGKKLLPETMGSGVAFLDYDNDGKPDILFVNSCDWPGFEKKDQPSLALYRNKGDGTFEDVTKAAGLNVTMYAMGVTVGDIDNDGWPDIFVSGVGGNRLFRNVARPDKTRRFVDVTDAAGVRGTNPWPGPAGADFLHCRTPISFPSSATFVDYDGDGKLDLFVCHYVTWSPEFDLGQPFQLVGVGRAFGPPTAFEATQCVLYRNLGNGRFEDVSRKAGIHVFNQDSIGQLADRPVPKSLGVIVFDVDDDGWPDIIVANDTVRNLFFHNKGDGTFEEIGVLHGVGLADGRARGAMGIDCAEYKPDRYAVALANFADEPITFLRLDNRKQMLFSDAAMAEGLAGPSRPLLKFGLFFFDYDLDGRPDLFTANGHLEPEIDKVQAGQSYAQPAQLFWNSGGKATFVAVGEQEAGTDLFKPMVGRGCAFADIDGDGYLDVVITANGGPARLLRNEGGTGNHWIRLALEGDGVRSNRSAIGARVTLEADGRGQHQQVTAGRGYLSQSELVLTFGLGKAAKVDKVTIQWPGKAGTTDVLTGLAVDKVHRIKQK